MMGWVRNFTLLIILVVVFPSFAEVTRTTTTPTTGAANRCTPEATQNNREIMQRCEESWVTWGIDKPPANELRSEADCSSSLSQTGKNILQGCAQAVVAPFVFMGTLAATGIVMLATQEDQNSDAYIFRNGNLEAVTARVSENWFIERCGLGSIREEEFVLRECPQDLLSTAPRDCNPALAKLREQQECRRSSETRRAYREVVSQLDQESNRIFTAEQERKAAQTAQENAIQQINSDCGIHINPYRRSLIARFTNPSDYLLGEMMHQLKPSPESVEAFNNCLRSHPLATETVVNKLLEEPSGLVDALVNQYEAFSCYSAPIRNELYCDIAIAVLSGGTAIAAKSAQRLGQRGLRAAARHETREVAGDVLATRLQGFRGQPDFDSVMDTGRRALGVEELTAAQSDSLYRAHLVGRGELGRDGINPAGVGNYTDAQLLQKNRILAEAFDERAVRRALMESGAAGDVNTATQAFRAAYGRRDFSGDNKYASALITGLDGSVQRRSMRIMNVNEDGSLDVIVEVGENDFRRMTYPRENLQDVRLSDSSKTLFENFARQRFDRIAEARGAIEVSSVSGNVYSGTSQGIRTINGEKFLVIRTATGEEQVLRVDRLNLESMRGRAPPQTAPSEVVAVAQSARTELPSYNAAGAYNANAPEAVLASQTRYAAATASQGDSIYGGMGYWREWSGNFTRMDSIPVQGWKVHVSARVENAGDVADTVLPILRERGIVHKVIADVPTYQQTVGRQGETQVGKFITFYPRTEAEAREISRIVSDALSNRGFGANDFIPVPGEENAGIGLYARYGKIQGTNLVDSSGNVIPDSVNLIFDNRGNPVPDTRGSARPSWIAPLGR